MWWLPCACLLLSQALSAGPPDAAAPTLRLREAIGEALRHAPDLGASHDAVAASAVGERLAASRFDLQVAPTFSAARDATGVAAEQAGLLVSKRLPTGTAIAGSLTSSWYDSGGSGLRDAGFTVSLSQSLLDGFGAVAAADLTRARRVVQGAERSLVEMQRQLVVTVAETYFAIVRQQRLAAASERSRDRAIRLLSASRARADAGLATQLDVLRAELLAAQSGASLAVQIETLQAARDRLKILLGRPVDSDLGEVADDLDDPLPADDGGAPVRRTAEPAIETLTGAALSQRLDVREARDRILDARRDAARARWMLLPPVTVDVSYSKRGLGAGATRAFAGAFDGWRVGMSTAYAFDRAAELASVDRAGIAERAAVRDARAVEARVIAEVRLARRSRLRADESIAIQQTAVGLAEKQLRLAELRYQRGLADNVDIVDAETNLFQAQSALIAAQLDRALAGLALQRATGDLNPEDFRR